uniref:Uncharacterized protein n=1 Tax=Arundo donax TaxID=35708 RepID=A0A0A9DT07_ARUDO
MSISVISWSTLHPNLISMVISCYVYFTSGRCSLEANSQTLFAYCSSFEYVCLENMERMDLVA